LAHAHTGRASFGHCSGFAHHHALLFTVGSTAGHISQHHFMSPCTPFSHCHFHMVWSAFPTTSHTQSTHHLFSSLPTPLVNGAKFILKPHTHTHIHFLCLSSLSINITKIGYHLRPKQPNKTNHFLDQLRKENHCLSFPNGGSHRLGVTFEFPYRFLGP